MRRVAYDFRLKFNEKLYANSTKNKLNLNVVFGTEYCTILKQKFVFILKRNLAFFFSLDKMKFSPLKSLTTKYKP